MKEEGNVVETQSTDGNETPIVQAVPNDREAAMEAAAKELQQQNVMQGIEAAPEVGQDAVSDGTDITAQPVVEQKPVTKVERFSKKYIENQKKERELRALENEIKQREQKLLSQRPGNDEDAKLLSVDEIKRLAKVNPQRALKSIGIDEKYLYDFIANDGKLPENVKIDVLKDELETKLKTLELKQQEFFELQQQTQQEEAVKQWRGMIGDMIKGSDEYSLLSELEDPITEVETLVRGHYQQQLDAGIPDEMVTIYSPEEAAKMIEDHLRKEIERLVSSNGYKKAFVKGQGTAPATQKKKEDVSTTKQGVKDEDSIEEEAQNWLTKRKKTQILNEHLQVVPNEKSTGYLQLLREAEEELKIA